MPEEGGVYLWCIVALHNTVRRCTMRGCIAERVGCVGGAGASGEKMHYTVRKCIARKYAVMRCIACNSERYL